MPRLYVVPTPIGNLEDITVQVLRELSLGSRLNRNETYPIWVDAIIPTDAR